MSYNKLVKSLSLSWKLDSTRIVLVIVHVLVYIELSILLVEKNLLTCFKLRAMFWFVANHV